MIVQFGEYAPDLPPTQNPGLTVAKNCLPLNGYYASFPDVTVYASTALSTQALGFGAFKDVNGNSYSYCGDTSDLFAMTSGAQWTNATHASGIYSTATGDCWEFAQWGNFVLATNYADDLQEMTLGGNVFTNVAGSPPKARHMGIVRDFVVLGNCLDYSSGASVPNRIHWSGFNNKDTWTPDATTQADIQDLREGGWVQRIIGGEYGTIFSEKSITRMTYVGTPLIFQFDVLESNRGTPAPNSVIKVGSFVFYLGQDSFYAFDGVRSTDISAGRIYNTFITDYQSSNFQNVWAAADPANTYVLWAYPGNGSVNGKPNKVLVYNYAVNRWAGPIEINLQMLCVMQSTGYTLDTLDTISTSIDSGFYASFDSRIYMGGALNIGAFDTDGRLVSFTGNALTATLETGDRELIPGRKTFITNVRPFVEGSSASVSIALSGRNRTLDTASFGASTVINSEGESCVFSEARYHRVRTTIAGGFTHASHVEIAGYTGGQY